MFHNKNEWVRSVEGRRRDSLKGRSTGYTATVKDLRNGSDSVTWRQGQDENYWLTFMHPG